MEAEAKVQENRLRRVLTRRGYTLTKSRRRDPLAVDFLAYTITDQDGKIVYGPGTRDHRVTLDDIEKWINR